VMRMMSIVVLKCTLLISSYVSITLFLCTFLSISSETNDGNEEKNPLIRKKDFMLACVKKS